MISQNTEKSPGVSVTASFFKICGPSNFSEKSSAYAGMKKYSRAIIIIIIIIITLAPKILERLEEVLEIRT